MNGLKQYEKYSIHCTSKKKEDKQIYKEFKEKMKKYLVHEGMGLYRIPILSEDYQYAKKLSLKYAWDWSREDEMEDFPGVYITGDETIETDYTKKDYEQAVAYLVHFWYLAYLYEDIGVDEYEGTCCAQPKWNYATGIVQNTELQIPSAEFKNRKYAQLMKGYALGKEARDLLLEHELATEEDFQNVTNRKGGIVCYQLMPKNIIHGFTKDNNMKLVDKCEHCGMERYWYYEEPYYISQDTLNQLVGLNQTKEQNGGYFDEEIVRKNLENGEDMQTLLEPWYIVNKEVYTLLHKHYPRMQFIPIFLKEEKK